MVTRNRSRIAERSVACFARQSWPNKELVVIDDGTEDYSPMLDKYSHLATIRYLRRPANSLGTLGEARNYSLEQAHGDLLMQWDDDDWYHPERIAFQMKPIEKGADAVLLRHTLMHVDHHDYIDKPYRTHIRIGTPGTIIHRRSSIRYPCLKQREDSIYMREWRAQHKTVVLGNCAHLFIRCFHGNNTWNIRHFLERLDTGVFGKFDYWYAKHWHGDLLRHRAFRLNSAESLAARDFLQESRTLGILTY